MTRTTEMKNASELLPSEASSVKNQLLTEGINMEDSKALTIGTTSVRQVGELYSLNDLHKESGGRPGHRPGYFLENQQTQALVNEIETAGIPAVKTKEGRNGGTFACKELVIAYAAWISAAFHLKVIRVFLEALPAQQVLRPESDLHYVVAKLSKQVALLSCSTSIGIELIPITQSREISTRLERLGKLFHPSSDQFSDVLGISRALRGLDPRMGASKAGWVEVLPKITA